MIHEIHESNEAALQKYNFVIINYINSLELQKFAISILTLFITIIIILGDKTWFNTPKLYSILTEVYRSLLLGGTQYLLTKKDLIFSLLHGKT